MSTARLRSIAVVLAVALLPIGVGVARGLAANRGLYAPLTAGEADPAAGAARRTHDPDKPTAVVVVGARATVAAGRRRSPRRAAVT